MQDHLDDLKRIAFQSNEESRGIAEISLQSQKDSRTLKALTYIATLYLPATLLAVRILEHNSNCGKLILWLPLDIIHLQFDTVAGKWEH